MIDQQTTSQGNYQTLGKKVFWLFFYQMSSVGWIILLFSIIVFAISFQPFPVGNFLADLQRYSLWVSLILFLISVLIIATAIAISWLTYINYTFLMADDSLKIRRGILNKTENAIPYRQIQNVDIERNFFFQMLGLSRLIILTAGREDEPKQNSDESEGVIPAIDQKIAEFLQSELLKRADIQKVVQTNN